MYLSAAEEINMSIFRRTKSADIDPKEAVIQAIRKETLDQAKKTTKSVGKVNNLLEKERIGVTELIFYATGGERRSKK